uniref:Uncharacterized protein n=1 Tax=Sphaerodactylus townsendi TaxID=933632 RepID=A0ACB8F4S4_9SAUR
MAGGGGLRPSPGAAGCWSPSGGIGRRRLPLLLHSLLLLLLKSGSAIQGEELHACKEGLHEEWPELKSKELLFSILFGSQGGTVDAT